MGDLSNYPRKFLGFVILKDMIVEFDLFKFVTCEPKND